MFGQDLTNTASGQAEWTITTWNVNRLQPKWTFTTGGDVSARAAVVNDVVYFPDWGGNLWAVNANNGHLIWGHQLSDYGLAANTHSRTTPAW
jgi:polyvinyl alcohol dehydrogenase (cytochrome)